MKVLFTKRALSNFNSIKYFIEKKWGKSALEAFHLKTADFINLLSAYPEIGSIELAERNIRGFQLTQQTRIIYRIKQGRIIILALFDVRQNPKKKTKIIFQKTVILN